MGFVSFFLRFFLSGALGLLFMQMAVPPDEPQEDPFLRATTPVTQFLAFNDDFSSRQKDKFMQWIHPKRGLVKNGILLTREEAQAEFEADQAAAKDLRAINLRFNYGEFVGANCYQADTWVEYKIAEASGENWYRFHNIFVFEIIDGLWYLVQSEYVRSEAEVTAKLESPLNQQQNLPPELQRFSTPYTVPVRPGVSAWPLLLGTNYVKEGQLHALQGKTISGKTWTLAHAVAERKPTVLYFFSIHSLWLAKSDEFHQQMNYLSSLYRTFGREKLYIFGVSDEPKEEIEWLGESGYDDFAPLLDEGSMLHATLGIDIHPYIVVFDADGTVVGISKTFHPSSLWLIEERIKESIARAQASSQR